MGIESMRSFYRNFFLRKQETFRYGIDDKFYDISDGRYEDDAFAYR